MQPQDHHEHVADRVRSGAYFEEAREWYDDVYHKPLAERSFLIVLLCLAALLATVALDSVMQVFPLSRTVPFPVMVQDIGASQARIVGLARGDQDVNAAVLRYMVGQYVTMREGYQVNSFSRNVLNVQFHSTEAVFRLYRNAIDPTREDSPITRYQQRMQRSIRVQAIDINRVGDLSSAKVTYQAIVTGGEKTEKSLFTAELTFRYSDIVVDQETGKITPMSFQVTGYNTHPIRE